MLLWKYVEQLVENRRFRPESFAAVGAQTQTSEARAQAIQNRPTVQEKTHEKKPERAKSGVPYNAVAGAKRLFLRVPSAKDVRFYKARNLVEIFEGALPTFFYYDDEKRYETDALGVLLSPYVMQELCDLLGEENVILK
jgi:hypothetical protein